MMMTFGKLWATGIFFALITLKFAGGLFQLSVLSIISFSKMSNCHCILEELEESLKVAQYLPCTKLNEKVPERFKTMLILRVC